jgi:CRP/FNR family transcriptional regulator
MAVREAGPYDARHAGRGARIEAPRAGGNGRKRRVDVRIERISQELKAVPMFKGLTPAEIHTIAALGRLAEFERGDHLWHEGDEAGALTVILRGRVKIVKRTPDGGSTILELFNVGEPVGAIAVYNYTPYPADAVCMEPVTLFSVDRRDYFAMLDSNPQIARGLIRELTRIAVMLTRKLEELRGMRVEARIARLFLLLGQRMGRPDGAGMVIPVPLSRQEVADLVGTTVESAIRTLSRWGRSDLVRTEESGFVVPDVARLEAAAQGLDED